MLAIDGVRLLQARVAAPGGPTGAPKCTQDVALLRDQRHFLEEVALAQRVDVHALQRAVVEQRERVGGVGGFSRALGDVVRVEVDRVFDGGLVALAHRRQVVGADQERGANDVALHRLCDARQNAVHLLQHEQFAENVQLVGLPILLAVITMSLFQLWS